MSKVFFKGRIETRQNHVLSGYNVNRCVKAGTEAAPISVVVNTEERKLEIETFLSHLVMNRNVASSTQNQAFNAILFLS